ncbi:MAG: hypothetical protein GC205_01890 [Bacteroidetes bacterium]|nr:hypothetical protein [Bacteroidota bacterium]
MIEKERHIAILGRREAFHGAAAGYHFGHDVVLLESDSFDVLIDHVQSGRAAYGVMAWENSLAGPVPGNQERLRLSGLHASSEILLSINLHLAGMAGTPLSALREVHSHPMALKQVSRFLRQHPWITAVEASDTANAARKVAEKGDPSLAAVTGQAAIAQFGLALLQPNVEDRRGNQTRFLVLQKEPPSTENPERILLTGQPDGGLSSLSGPLAAMHAAGLKLRRLDSLPDPDGGWRYQLYLDFNVEGRMPWQAVQDWLSEQLPELRLLGVFPAGKTYIG